MVRPSGKDCDTAAKNKLNHIHFLVGKGQHNSCYQGQKKLVPHDGKRLNAYMDTININNIDLTAYRFAPKSVHYLCSSMELTINKSLKKYDDDQIKKEEGYFANRYNLRLNQIGRAHV